MSAGGEKLQAQNTSIGVIGGFNASSHLHNFRFVVDDINLDFTPGVSMGYNTGFIIRTEFNPAFRIQFEPSLLIIGAKYNETFNLRGVTFQSQSKTELTYVQLPILFQYSSVPPERVVYGRQFSETTYHITGGAYGGYLLDARFSGTNTGAPIGIAFQGDFSNNVIDQYSEFDAGVILGIGLEHGLYNKLGFETRFLFSVVNSGDDPQIDFSTHNMGITFSLYFLF